MDLNFRKFKVYLDTSVISYLEQDDAPEKMADTRAVWDTLKRGDYDIFVSQVVLKELNDCRDLRKKELFFKHLREINFNIVEITEDTIALAEKFIDFGILKQKSLDDCQHIAAAILNDCDIIISWNFKHIVNVKTIRGIKVITTMQGRRDLLIYPPTALLEEA